MVACYRSLDRGSSLLWRRAGGALCVFRWSCRRNGGKCLRTQVQLRRRRRILCRMMRALSVVSYQVRYACLCISTESQCRAAAREEVGNYWRQTIPTNSLVRSNIYYYASTRNVESRGTGRIRLKFAMCEEGCVNQEA